jgi:AAA domain
LEEITQLAQDGLVSMELRQDEIKQITSALLSAQSVLVVGEPGAGKSTVGLKVQEQLGLEGYDVAIASYSGAAKETLIAIADQLGCPIETQDEKPKKLTAEQLRNELKQNICGNKTLLICDDAQRWSSSLRYWLEDVLRHGGLLLLLASSPPPKDIFTRMPVIPLPPLKDDEIRELMKAEAIAHSIRLTPQELADLQQRAGNNPSLAQRIVRETALGISEMQSTDHYQYIDGTPFLIGGLALVGIVRFIGMGMGDKALYLIGGILTIGTLIIRSLLYAANRGRRNL